jgi:hypothetical protein
MLNRTVKNIAFLWALENAQALLRAKGLESCKH